MALFVTLASAWGSLTLALLIVVLLLNRQRQRDLAQRSQIAVTSIDLFPARAPLSIL